MSDEEQLVVDYELLDTSAAELSALHAEFDGLSAWQDDLQDSVGHRKVGSAMDDFVGNWSYSRRKLMDQIEGLGAAVEGARDAFGQLQADLAGQLVEEK